MSGKHGRAGATARAPDSEGASASSGRSLYEKAGDAAAGHLGSQPRRLSRKTTEEQVEKSLYDNFRTFTSTEIDGTVVEGSTLRQRLAADKRLNRQDPKKYPMGQKYYFRLRTMYASTDHASARLVVKDSAEVVSPGLLKGMMHARGKQANRGALIGYLGTCDQVNQKDPFYVDIAFMFYTWTTYAYECCPFHAYTCLVVVAMCLQAFGLLV